MYDWVNNIKSKVEPIEDPFYGSLYRCSLTLKDGTFLPCAVIQPRQRLVDLAKRRIKEEMEGKARIGGDDIRPDRRHVRCARQQSQRL
jgi:hypothetical protein